MEIDCWNHAGLIIFEKFIQGFLILDCSGIFGIFSDEINSIIIGFDDGQRQVFVIVITCKSGFKIRQFRLYKYLLI